LIILEKEKWDNIGNDNPTKEFKNQNISRILEGNTSIVEHGGKHKSYILT